MRRGHSNLMDPIWLRLIIQGVIFLSYLKPFHKCSKAIRFYNLQNDGRRKKSGGSHHGNQYHRTNSLNQFQDICGAGIFVFSIAGYPHFSQADATKGERMGAHLTVWDSGRLKLENQYEGTCKRHYHQSTVSKSLMANNKPHSNLQARENPTH